MEICKQNCMNMIDEYDHLDVETMVNHPSNEFDSTLKNSMMSPCSTQQLDAIIASAITKKENIDSNMDLINRLMRQVESKEKEAEKAKEAADKYRLFVLAKVDELKKAHQIAKEANDLKSSEVHIKKAALATEMNELQLCVSGVLKRGDEHITDLDKMRRSLENRLTSAAMKKEAADNETIENEKSFSYQNQQMEKLKEESKRLKQEAMENLKLQQFINDRRRAINMLKEELSCKCLDIKLLKGEILDYQDMKREIYDYNYKDMKREIQDYKNMKGGIQDYKYKKKVLDTEEYCSFGPIIQEIRPVEEYQRTDGLIKGWIRNHSTRYYGQESKNKAMKEWINGEIKEAISDHEQGVFDINGYGCYSDCEEIIWF